MSNCASCGAPITEKDVKCGNCGAVNPESEAFRAREGEVLVEPLQVEIPLDPASTVDPVEVPVETAEVPQ